MFKRYKTGLRSLIGHRHASNETDGSDLSEGLVSKGGEADGDAGGGVFLCYYFHVLQWNRGRSNEMGAFGSLGHLRIKSD